MEGRDAWKGVSPDESEKRTLNLNNAFPDALVTHYETLIDHLELPDEKIGMYLAQLSKHAHVIVSNNIKDFPEDVLDRYGLKIKTPDDFLTDIIDLNTEIAVEAFKEMVLNKKNPELDEYEVLDCLRKNGLKDTADYLHALL